MVRRAKIARRTAAVLVETAITLPIFLLLVVGGIELALVVHFRNQTAWVATTLADEASRRGSRAESVTEPWGPETLHWSRTSAAPIEEGDNSDTLLERIQTLAQRLPSQEAEIRIEWLDGSNHHGDRVRVTVNCHYRSALSLGYSLPRLRAYSTSIVKY